MRLFSIANLTLVNLGFLCLLTTADYTSYPNAAFVNLRIEGETSTIFEDWIMTKGHNVTTASGGTHKCDGTNNHTNPTAGPTLTGALDDAARLKDFTWDGQWYSSFEDYFVTRIADSENTASKFWGLLAWKVSATGRGWRFTDVGGCQQRVVAGDQILIAYDAFNAQQFLTLSSSTYLTKVGKPVTVTVTGGGTSQTPVEGATVDGQTTGADGKVTLIFTSGGFKKLKAEKPGSIRSNEISIFVSRY